jgi:predicted Rossmann fold nucleotide-binding protein DprA/Smf involved in DNA uptake
MEGVGRVTARKVLGQFGGIGEPSQLPREQVLNRLKGVPNAASLLDRLDDEASMEAIQASIARRLEAWSARKIRVLTFLDPGWPERLNELPNPHRPNALFVYGDPKSTGEPVVAIVAEGAIEAGPFEAAQDLIRMVVSKNTTIGLDGMTGFDVVGIKLSLDAGRPPHLITSYGLASTPPTMRPHASSVAKAGGIMVSSFPMDHGPFDHDKKEGALVQSALARAVVFVDPKPKSFLWPALEWALSVGMPVFSIGGEDLPDRVHRIETSIDMEWVIAAVEHV